MSGPSCARILAGLAGVVLLLAGCGNGADRTDRSAAGDAAMPVTTAPRQVPPPDGGRLQTMVDTVTPGTDQDHVVLLYGDSVAVSLADDLVAAIPDTLVVDALDCRRLDRGFTGPCGGVPAGTAVESGLDELRAVVDQLGEDGTEVDVAVLIIANNAALSAQDVEAAMDTLAGLDRVWWVTTTVEGRAWRDPNNALLAETSRVHATAGLIDWFLHSAGHDWIGDFVHPNEAGQQALAGYIAEHLRCDCTP